MFTGEVKQEAILIGCKELSLFFLDCWKRKGGRGSGRKPPGGFHLSTDGISERGYKGMIKSKTSKVTAILLHHRKGKILGGGGGGEPRTFSIGNLESSE